MRTFVPPQKLQRDEDDVVKIEGVGFDQPPLVNRVYLLQLIAVYETAFGCNFSGLGWGYVVWQHASALELRDHRPYVRGLCLGLYRAALGCM